MDAEIGPGPGTRHQPRRSGAVSTPFAQLLRKYGASSRLLGRVRETAADPQLWVFEDTSTPDEQPEVGRPQVKIPAEQAEGRQAAGVSVNDPGVSLSDRRDVFVVHGSDAHARDLIFDFLRALGLRPTSWEEVALPGASTSPPEQTLAPIVGRGHAMIVLLTPEDLAGTPTPSGLVQGSARTQPVRGDVLTEAMMAAALTLERTVVIELGGTHPHPAVAGRDAVWFDGSPSQRMKVVNRLRAAGCKVDDNGTDWLTAGSLYSTLVEESSAPTERAADKSADTMWNRLQSRWRQVLVLDRGSRFPADSALRLALLGRFELEGPDSGVERSVVYQECIAAFQTEAQADPHAFVAHLRSVAADAADKFVSYGAYSLALELLGHGIKTPDFLALLDEAIKIKRQRGLPSASLTGFEWQRWLDVNGPGTY